MDWKILSTVFTSVFIAELGDKTQLAAIAMASQTGKPWLVFIGAVAAFAIITFAGVFLGVGWG